MSTSNTIQYNGSDFFSANNLATPNIESRSLAPIVVGKKRGNKEVLILSGDIHIANPPVNCDYFTELKNIRDDLLNFFSEDYKELEIFEDGVRIFKKDFCEIVKIDFPSSKYVKKLPYTIEIHCLDELSHRELFGVKNVINSVSINKRSNGEYLISRQISAIGENTQDGSLSSNNINQVSNSFDNAFNFVKSKNGLTQEFIDSIENIGGNRAFYLVSNGESINRLTGYYSITEEWICGVENASSSEGIVNISIEETSALNNYNSYNISGDIFLGKSGSISSCREIFKNIDFKSKIQSMFGVSNIFQIPDSISITEDQKSNSIFFNLNYTNSDNVNDCGLYEEINYSIEKNDNMLIINASGEIRAKGYGRKRYGIVKDYFYGNSYDATLYTSLLHEKCQTEVDKFYSGITLYKKPETFSVSHDENDGVIAFSFTFSDHDKPYSSTVQFRDYNCTINISPPTPRYKVDMNFGGSRDKYLISRSGFDAAIISITLTGEYINLTSDRGIDKERALNELINQCNIKFADLKSTYYSTKQDMVLNKRKSYNKNNNIAQYFEERKYFDKIIR